ISGMAATLAVGESIAALSSLGGAAHGGINFVPDERTFLLNRGERVIQPKANEDLTEFLEGGGHGSQTVHLSVYLDAREILNTVSDASKDGRLTIHANAL